MFNEILINGKVIKTSGNNIIISNGEVIIDDQVIQSSIGHNVKVVINGDVNQIECSGSLEVHGNTGEIDCSGNCHIDGNVDGDIDAGGSVNCGSVIGNIDAGGSVNCGSVTGNIDAGGNVNGQKPCGSPCDRE